MSQAEQAERIRMKEMQKEVRRQQEMRVAMAVLVANMRKGPNGGGHVAVTSPHPNQTSYFWNNFAEMDFLSQAATRVFSVRLMHAVAFSKY